MSLSYAGNQLPPWLQSISRPSYQAPQSTLTISMLRIRVAIDLPPVILQKPANIRVSGAASDSFSSQNQRRVYKAFINSITPRQALKTTIFQMIYGSISSTGQVLISSFSNLSWYIDAPVKTVGSYIATMTFVTLFQLISSRAWAT